MRIFYSGAKKQGDIQVDISKSLGGILSSTEIPNGRINNIFSDLSFTSKTNNYKETKAIFLQNKTTSNIANVVLYVLYGENNESIVQIAAVKPLNNEIEKIRTSKDIPYQASFYDADVVFAFSEITLLDDGVFTPNEIISIEGRTFQMSSSPTSLEFFSKFKSTFSEDVSYVATVNEDGKSGRLTFKIKGEFEDTPEINSTSDIILYTSFQGGLDNSRLLAETLAPEESIGLWLCKTINSLPKEDIFSKFEKFKLNNYLPIDSTTDGLEQIDFVLEFDIV